ncbi:uncharacterized protein LOC132731448 isoform X2 [Ruditapes philippinarum]|uniref:uncharacterized protein LOC132731448 isoform X2 n=1 Tax=Ruditapes philippinarum TaxID=129788 RepID=UPI00295BB7B9|nr:uncharacterized protein LOC132731448 isoform X2 [Ruditapes philippinarum]
MASGSYTLPCGFKPPSESYVFDNLIADLSQAISEQELENLKQRFERVQHVRTPREMFDSLRDMGFIGNYDILYIQQIVRVLDRVDLVEKLLKYVQMFEEDTVLHFVQEKKITTNGFILVQFHVKGKGISETCQLEEFRREASCIKPEVPNINQVNLQDTKAEHLNEEWTWNQRKTYTHGRKLKIYIKQKERAPK